MKKSNKIILLIIIAVLLVGGVVVFFLTRNSNGVPKGKYTAFATCLKNSGTTFYGAFWCPHCNATKKLFGDSVKLLPYVECSTPDAAGQTQICQDKKIKGYPSWVFPTAINLESADAPHKCTDSQDETPVCKQSYNTDFDTWVFSSIDSALVGTNSEPTHKGTTWTFAPGSRLSGEVSLEMLAKQTSCTLPQ